MRSAMIDSRQIRAARALLEWSQQELADRTRLSLTALNRVERNATDARGSTLYAIREVLHAAGIDFLERADGAIGVLLRGDAPKAHDEVSRLMKPRKSRGKSGDAGGA